MRILVFGKTGQVARELRRIHWPVQCTVQSLGRADCDLLDTQAVTKAILAFRPEVVINAAAYTAVDRAETDIEAAERVNRDAPAAMATACRDLDAALIHLSTDYVFDGSKTEPYLERDRIAPLSVYGRTKAEGEFAIREVLPYHVIIRTSWVFAAHGANFVRTMLRLAKERDELRVVADQKGAPTAACDIAKAIASVVLQVVDGKGIWGAYHFTGDEPTTWFAFAGAIFDRSGRHPNLIPIATADYRTAARRPMNSLLDCGRIERDYRICQPSWRLALKHVLMELGETVESAGA
jgi:dTDP-4-dehydrorhamnose reductase